MGIFGSEKTDKKIVSLENKIEKLAKDDIHFLNKLKELQNSITEAEKRSPDYEREAKQASKKTSEYRNKALETQEEASSILENINGQKEEISNIKNELSTLKNDIEEEIIDVRERKQEIYDAKSDILSKIDLIEERIEQITQIFNKYPDLSSSLENLENFTTQVEENQNKSNQLLRGITSRKNEIDNIYREISGFEQENEETGETSHIPGIKDELEETYTELEIKSNSLTKQISLIEKTTSDNYEAFIKSSAEKNLKLENEWKEKHSEINDKIKKLLPNALTAGLSYAFSKKKEDEDSSYEKHKKQFGNGIIGLVLVSSIPFILSIVFLNQNKTLDDVIDRIPRIVLAIIPLYLPVLWLAFSSNKKMNLSKRLIEEYSHKEVLSKTFEGLSSQINDLDDNPISNELRIKLLQDFMQVYSENPGKLISNYEKSDHPIMDVLEQSHKLESAVERLKKLPGIDKVTRVLEKKSEKILDKGEEMVERGLENMEKLENNEDEDV
ncbi:hypothetical protein E0W68_10070 [Flavobacterium salilacus subsp. salilacus]|uniref:hypothetical protein n=1 Tax=Flavobacterium TaxID=237 RepID=UPI001074A63F|nr:MULTISPECIES: hypothetical protein [Flavobacterium]KAF2518358.1 hypothetical protein E0W68_10070 [Flavobacterium salilacus subsp. salilacus]MBE1615227.1 hypothetical protein [Flavobacterium sp. SaA2.13]